MLNFDACYNVMKRFQTAVKRLLHYENSESINIVWVCLSSTVQYTRIITTVICTSNFVVFGVLL